MCWNEFLFAAYQSKAHEIEITLSFPNLLYFLSTIMGKKLTIFFENITRSIDECKYPLKPAPPEQYVELKRNIKL